ncbi:MAG: hypothetical protein HYT79_00140 [Elusimicrobia bacterium]|nr:hypothetical protein [Elusimicrobiota bacterium]
MTGHQQSVWPRFLHQSIALGMIAWLKTKGVRRSQKPKKAVPRLASGG